MGNETETPATVALRDGREVHAWGPRYEHRVVLTLQSVSTEGDPDNDEDMEWGMPVHVDSAYVLDRVTDIALALSETEGFALDVPGAPPMTLEWLSGTVDVPTRFGVVERKLREGTTCGIHPGVSTELGVCGACQSEEYQGWPNRETWSLVLYLENDQQLATLVHRVARTAWETAAVHPHVTEGVTTRYARARGDLSETVKGMVEAWRDDAVDGVLGRDRRVVLLDVGSLWRIDWFAVARALLAGIDVHPDTEVPA